MRTRKGALEILHDQTLSVIIDSEIQIEYLKKQDPKMIVMSKIERFAGTPMQKDYTATMLIEKEEGRLKENKMVLDIIVKKIEGEKSSPKPSPTPQGPTS